MADQTRDRSGSLSPAQLELLGHLADGMSQVEAGEEMDIPIGTIRNMVAKSILPKMGCDRTFQAMAQYGWAHGLREAVVVIQNSYVAHPTDPAEEHLNAVLEVLARNLECRAKRLLP